MLWLSRLRLHAALRLPCRHCAALRHECVLQRCRQGLRRMLPSACCMFSPNSHQMPQHMLSASVQIGCWLCPRRGGRHWDTAAGKLPQDWFRLNGLSGRIWMWRMVVPIRLLWAVVAGVKRYGPFCIPKAAILEIETGRMGTQNGPFCNGVEKRPWRQADVGTACRWR